MQYDTIFFSHKKTNFQWIYAPEYAVLGHVPTKSDVFSFGVIILETVTGRRNTSSGTMMAQHRLSYVSL